MPNPKTWLRRSSLVECEGHLYAPNPEKDAFVKVLEYTCDPFGGMTPNVFCSQHARCVLYNNIVLVSAISTTTTRMRVKVTSGIMAMIRSGGGRNSERGTPKVCDLTWICLDGDQMYQIPGAGSSVRCEPCNPQPARRPSPTLRTTKHGQHGSGQQTPVISSRRRIIASGICSVRQI